MSFSFNVKLNDFAVLKILLLDMSESRYSEYWLINFVRLRNLKLKYINYERSKLLKADDRSDVYVIYKKYYQLCKVQAADTVSGARYKLKLKESLESNESFVTTEDLTMSEHWQNNFTLINKSAQKSVMPVIKTLKITIKSYKQLKTVSIFLFAMLISNIITTKLNSSIKLTKKKSKAAIMKKMIKNLIKTMKNQHINTNINLIYLAVDSLNNLKCTVDTNSLIKIKLKRIWVFTFFNNIFKARFVTTVAAMLIKSKDLEIIANHIKSLLDNQNAMKNHVKKQNLLI